MLHGCHLRICQLTILCSDSIHNQPKFLFLQTEHDLQAVNHTHKNDTRVEKLYEMSDSRAVTGYESTNRVPLPVVVLLPVEDLFLFAYRQSDPAFGYV